MANKESTNVTGLESSTNFEQDEDSRIAMEAQVDAYLIKADITPRRLVEIVHQVLD